MPIHGGAIQLANWPGSRTCFIRLPIKSKDAIARFFAGVGGAAATAAEHAASCA
jgi:hypothetical protein